MDETLWKIWFFSGLIGFCGLAVHMARARRKRKSKKKERNSLRY